MSMLADPEIPAMEATASDELYVGPAVVIALGTGQFTVAFAGTAQVAQPAFALSYRPVVGDVLLVIANRRSSRAVYAVGVLSGQGTTALSATGDLDLSAPRGRITLNAGSGVEIAAPRLRIQTQIVELFATALVQRVQSALLAVAELFHVTAGQKLEHVAGSAMEHAGTRHLTSDKETVVNGSSIHIA